MLSISEAVIIGIIEGFTEFMPISSTGHMIIASNMLGIEQTDIFKSYEVIIQLSAIFAVILLYKDKIKISNIPLWKNIFIASLPILIVGFIFKDYIKDIFTINIVAIMFIVGGFIFLITEYLYKHSKKKKNINIDNITSKQALVIGIFQIFALIPGASRAGATIIGGMLNGLNRKISTEFSFFVAIPVILAVSGYSIIFHFEDFYKMNILSALIGFFVSFLVAYFTIKLLMNLLSKFTFIGFGIYRIIFGLILLFSY